ncbi:MAG TPA: ATP-binding protein [Candidatus Saccharimonadales bacterium]|nr:ATP-binding protein [Candidatus Saccharimonadales bacterium]
MSAKLFLMIGYPGAGKTTTAEMISKITGAVRLSSDEVRFSMFPEPTFSQEEHGLLYRELDSRTEALLRKGVSVIYDANLNRKSHRQEKYDICERTGAVAVALWLRTPRSLAKERAIHESRSHFAPKDETLGSMFERITEVFEPPTPEEHALVLDGTALNEAQVSAFLADHHLL